MEQRHHAAAFLLCVAVLSLGMGAMALSMLLPTQRCAPDWLGGVCSSNADVKTAIAVIGGVIMAAAGVVFAVTRKLDDDPTAD